jgi:hypothetical protein
MERGSIIRCILNHARPGEMLTGRVLHPCRRGWRSGRDFMKDRSGSGTAMACAP